MTPSMVTAVTAAAAEPNSTGVCICEVKTHRQIQIATHQGFNGVAQTKIRAEVSGKKMDTRQKPADRRLTKTDRVLGVGVGCGCVREGASVGVCVCVSVGVYVGDSVCVGVCVGVCVRGCVRVCVRGSVYVLPAPMPMLETTASVCVLLCVYV
jgi:hypothetical protein